MARASRSRKTKKTRKVTSPTSRAARSSPATLRRRLRSGRKRVIVYLHDSQRHKQHHWTLDRLLLMIQHESPVLDDDPDRTFVVGGTRKYLAISTAGAHYFIGQHPLWGEKGKMEGAMLFDNVIFENVRESLEKFYAGRSGEGCFAPYDGRFEFYRPDKA